MKRIWISFICALATIYAAAYDFSAKDVNNKVIYYNYLGGDSVEVTSYWGDGSGGDHEYKGTIIIPDTVYNNDIAYCVTAIKDKAFRWCSQLDSVCLPPHIVRIGKEAFFLCHQVKLTIPPQVKVIDSCAFYMCYEITGSIPETVEYLGDYAFYRDYNIEQDLIIGYNNRYIGKHAFDGCTRLTSLTINSYYDPIIGEAAFANCSSIASINISYNSTYNSWDNCNAIIETNTNRLILGCKNTIIPYTVTEIADKAFLGMLHGTYSEPVSFPEIPYGVTTIGELAFAGSTAKGPIIIPRTVTRIGNQAFAVCQIEPDYENAMYSTESVVVEYGNPVYDSRDNCNAIIETATNTLIAGFSSSMIPSSVTKIGDYAFSGIDGYYGNLYLNTLDIPSTITSIGKGAYAYCNSLPSVSIPNSINSIGDSAFFSCRELQSVTISHDIATTGTDVFESCENLKTIHYTGSVAKFCEGLVHLGNTGDIYINDDAIVDLEIPEGVEDIAKYTFAYCQTIKSVSLPKTLKRIHACAFSGYACVIDTIFCAALVPPIIQDTIYEYGDEHYYSGFNCNANHTILYVPTEAKSVYGALEDYSDYFAQIKGYSEVTDITETEAKLSWRPDIEVVRYEIDILKGAVVVKHYDVDGSGHLIVPSPMPPICRMKKDTTTSSADFFVIKVSDLEAGTDYNYTIQGTNASHQSIYHEAGDFRTKSIPLDCDPLSADERRKARKVLQDGQMLIIRDERTYTVMGVEMK